MAVLTADEERYLSCMSCGGWHLTQLGAPPAAADSPLVGFVRSGFFLAGNDNAMQLAWSGSSWGVTNLTTTAN
jgi:hypothetical protein